MSYQRFCEIKNDYNLVRANLICVICSSQCVIQSQSLISDD